MPSSHSATVTALAIGVGLKEGFGGSLFATALIFACVVCSSLLCPWLLYIFSFLCKEITVLC